MTGASIARTPPQPPLWIERERAWLITRYADVAFVLRSQDVGIAEVAPELQRLSDRVGGDAFENLILLFGSSHPFHNAQSHAPIRARLKDMLDRAMQRWDAEAIAAKTSALLSAFDGQDRIEGAGLAKGLPAAIAGDMLAMDAGDVIACGDLARELNSIWYRSGNSLRQLRALETLAASLVAKLTGHFGRARRDDFALFTFLTMAAVDTTASLLASCINHLAQDLDIQERLRRNPGLLHSYIAEALRCWPPLKRVQGRKTTAPIALADATIPSDSILVCDIESAHHDPVAYGQPDQFEVNRKGLPTLAFAAGARACVGAVLARLEVRVFLERTLRDYVIRPAGEARRLVHPDWYMFESVPLQLVRL